ncbi:hypothetical protein SAMN05421853_101322 [Roseivivax halotolerans]|jgi:hypothetical protein|uniref:DUF6455 domain-containing protein n=1 Tax=Roseivivax halotolerans TaxID=93684 RepID=A0A1I5V405_9RHOB|nr:MULTISPECIES: DUF6455 family protein [Roseivivax]QFT64813.1 hypothetical protein FIU91_17885 [Roseivivax sp. THAF30]SFQ02294.1 hypothetical protein SAMN05421853_101322 [Roseivivax halotolerans]
MVSRKIRDKHETLVSRMADTLGLDLEELGQRGLFPSAERDDAILSCLGCTQLGSCEAFLLDTVAADAAPPYCRNAERFATLSDKAR